jgi:hypothetical protein
MNHPTARDAVHLFEKIAQAEKRYNETLLQPRQERTQWRSDRLELERLQQSKDHHKTQIQIAETELSRPPQQTAGNDTGEQVNTTTTAAANSTANITDPDKDEEDIHKVQLLRLAQQQQEVNSHAEEVLSLRTSLHDLQTEHSQLLTHVQQLKRSDDLQELEEESENWQSLYFESCELGSKKIQALQDEMDLLQLEQQQQQQQPKSDNCTQQDHQSTEQLQALLQLQTQISNSGTANSCYY